MVIGGVAAVRKYISLTEEITFQLKKKKDKIIKQFGRRNK